MLAHALVAFAALCLSQFSLVSASESQTDQTNISPLYEDPKCPHGLYPGFESNEWQFTVPASVFMNKTGSFFHAEWYTGAIKSTRGKDNVVGAMRTMVSHEGSDLFTERLMGYYRSPTQLVLRYSLANGPVMYKTMIFGSYTEEFRVTSICGGTATHIAMTATYCTNDVVSLYNIYDVYRREMVQAVANELGALVFSGTCPTVNSAQPFKGILQQTILA